MSLVDVGQLREIAEVEFADIVLEALIPEINALRIILTDHDLQILKALTLHSHARSVRSIMYPIIWTTRSVGFAGALEERAVRTKQRRQHNAELKARVALEAIRGERTIHELAAEYGVHPVHITPWKKVILEEVPTLFSRRRGAKAKEEEALQAAL